MISNPGVMYRLEPGDEVGSSVYIDLDIPFDTPLRAVGVWGECNVGLSKRGDLFVGPGCGSNSYESFTANRHVSQQTCSGPWSVDADYVGTVKFSPQCVLPPDCSKLFSNCPNLRFVDFGSADMSQVEDMSNMFSDCDALLEVRGDDCGLSNLKSTENMFSGCSHLKSADFGQIDVKAMPLLQSAIGQVKEERLCQNFVPDDGFGTQRVGASSDMSHNDISIR